MVKNECLICGESLVYSEIESLMECSVCHKKEASRTYCKNGHYVCNDCHTAGLDSIIGVCISEKSKNPILILRKLMSLPFCHMHGPEHHVLVGASLLTAYKNSGGKINLEKTLVEIIARGKKVPGGFCGFWGACGAGISSGIFISIITSSTPLSQEPWGLSNKMTASALAEIGNLGGPRCCKRNSYLSVIKAVEFVKENMGISMDLGEVSCVHFTQNNHCLKEKCPFYK